MLSDLSAHEIQISAFTSRISALGTHLSAFTNQISAPDGNLSATQDFRLPTDPTPSQLRGQPPLLGLHRDGTILDRILYKRSDWLMWFLYIMFALFAFVIVGTVAGLAMTFSNHK